MTGDKLRSILVRLSVKGIRLAKAVSAGHDRCRIPFAAHTPAQAP